MVGPFPEGEHILERTSQLQAHESLGGVEDTAELPGVLSVLGLGWGLLPSCNGRP